MAIKLLLGIPFTDTHLWLLMVGTLDSWAWNIHEVVLYTLHGLDNLWQRDAHLFQALETGADYLTQCPLLLLGPVPLPTTSFGLSSDFYVDPLHLWELTLVLQQLVLVIMTLFPMKEMPLFRLT